LHTTGKNRNAQEVLVRKSEKIRKLGKPRGICENNNKMMEK
jgi:hypothetical protein